MAKYKVLDRLTFDDKTYEVDDSVVINDAAIAEQLIAINVIDGKRLPEPKADQKPAA